MYVHNRDTILINNSSNTYTGVLKYIYYKEKQVKLYIQTSSQYPTPDNLEFNTCQCIRLIRQCNKSRNFWPINRPAFETLHWQYIAAAANAKNVDFINESTRERALNKDPQRWKSTVHLMGHFCPDGGQKAKSRLRIMCNSHRTRKWVQSITWWHQPIDSLCTCALRTYAMCKRFTYLACTMRNHCLVCA